MCLIRQILTSSRDAASAPEDGPCRAPRPQVAAMRWQSKQLPPARHNPVVLTLECQNRAWNAHGATVRNMSLIPACQRSRRWRRAQSQDTWHKLLFLRHPRETIPHQPPKKQNPGQNLPWGFYCWIRVLPFRLAHSDAMYPLTAGPELASGSNPRYKQRTAMTAYTSCVSSLSLVHDSPYLFCQSCVRLSCLCIDQPTCSGSCFGLCHGAA